MLLLPFQQHFVIYHHSHTKARFVCYYIASEDLEASA